ncbi:hypothetical protein H0V99_00130 [Candidatus Saccharibacteria bacterium]|nr:hypothetical protein [Candidatus Saccharibacteria bacterium]
MSNNYEIAPDESHTHELNERKETIVKRVGVIINGSIIEHLQQPTAEQHSLFRQQLALLQSMEADADHKARHIYLSL